MEKLEHQNHPQQNLDLASGFELYKKNLIKTAEKLLERHGIENYETIAPDLIQNVFLQLLRTNKALPNTKTKLNSLLGRYTQTAVDHYIRLVAKENPNNPKSIHIRESHFTSLDEAKNITVPPSQEKLNLEDLINSVKNITPLQKEILIARYIEDKNLKEIALEMGFKSYQAVGEHEYRALEALRENPKFQDLLGTWSTK